MVDISSSSTANSINVYDMICYYKDDDNENQDQNTVNDVIDNIEKGINIKSSRSENGNTVTRPSSTKIPVTVKLKLKLFGCVVMNVLLAAPIYGFVTIYILHREKLNDGIGLVWIPIIFNAIYLLVTPWLFNTFTSDKNNATNRNVITFFTLVMSTSISLSGFAFSYLDANFFLILVLYGVVGGMSSCIILGKMFVIINGILRNERLHMINFIYSLGSSLSQLILPFVNYFIMQFVCHNCSILIVGALMLNIIPICMLLIGNRDEFNEQLDGMTNNCKNKNKSDDLRLKIDDDDDDDESRYEDISMAFYAEKIKYPSDVLDMDGSVQWKNPSNFNQNRTSKGPNDDNFLEVLDSQRIMNADGVEILETITEEENDGDEIKCPDVDEMNMAKFNETENRSEAVMTNVETKIKKNEHFRIDRIVKDKWQDVYGVANRQIVNPLRRSLKIFQFYSVVLLKSVDIFSYLLFITFILPSMAMNQYQYVERENTIYLITLMGLCWTGYTICVLQFHKALRQDYIHYFHFIGLLAKFFGYLFTNQRYSLNGFIFGIILISLGHANSFHLQETVIRNCFHPRKWYYVRGPIYSFSGFLILIYCIIFHILYACLDSFVTFTNIFVLFNLCGILIWLLSNYEMVIYVCSKY